MQVDAIGIAAGRVWGFLAENGESSRAQIKKALPDLDEFTIAAAIGWLAREDKVILVQAGRAFNVALK
ncbi:MAG: winged helix-turn-helix domain-containing protein [Anaerolineae bacterium]|nr:winged helix-turn-helix domain-containing protein [Anaerolineae bacterium]